MGERFTGKVAIVTGAGGGIGEAYARGLAAEGAAVVIAEINETAGQSVAESITDDGGRAVAVTTDVSDEASTQTMAAATVEAFGQIDILVNNAAIYGDMRMDSLLTVPWDYYQRFMSVNMNGALLCTRACHKDLRKTRGVIVNQSSTAAWMGAGYYGIAKLAVHGITQSLARELGPVGIRVNAIAPGPVGTEATEKTAGAFADQIVATLPLPRMGTVGDLVGALLFLCSDDASWITGHVLNVDGGHIMRP